MSEQLVVLVGAGALGSHAAMLLRNACRLRVVDFDRLEARNVPSQFHARSYAGKNKAVALQGLMKLVYGTAVEAVPHKLDETNAHIIVPERCALVIDVVDNAAGRRAAQLGADARSIPCLHGGLAANGEYGLAWWDRAVQIDDAAPGARTCEDGEHVSFVAVVAARVAMAAQRYLRTGERRGYSVSPAHAAVT
jgi:predicted ThiF/HesA family dinucleotide-utilizing enzyme